MPSRRPSPHTPFIPPLDTPESSPQPPFLPQLVASSSSGSNQGGGLPTTTSQPWNASAYPPPQGGAGPAQPAYGGYTPFMSPGYVNTPAGPMPMNLSMMGGMGGMGMHSPPGFIPPYMTPAGAPPGVIPPGINIPGMTPGPGFQSQLPNQGYSWDYTGYPSSSSGMTPHSNVVPLTAPPTASQMHAAQATAQAQRAAAAAGGYGGYPGFGGGGGPSSAPIVPPMNWGPPPQGGGAWGAYQTPAAP